MTENGSEGRRSISTGTSSRPGDRDRATTAIDASRTPAENAQLALLLEVAGTPKPGNVDRERDLEDLRFEHFLAGAIGAGEGLRRAARGANVGVAFERAVAGMGRQSGGNTQFGCLLLLVPLVSAAVTEELTPEGLEHVVADTTVADAVAFYRAFEHVDVAVPDPPPDLDALDVRRGAAAAPAIRDRDLTLADVLSLSTETQAEDRIPDWNAVEWATGFERTFAVAESIRTDAGPVGDRAARAFIEVLADRPDSLVAIAHGPSVAREVSERAAAVRGDLVAADALADALVEEGINPGTTADTVAAGLFVALERGLSV